LFGEINLDRFIVKGRWRLFDWLRFAGWYLQWCE